MKITVVGAGFVGLTQAVVLAECGHDVYVYDINETKIADYQSGTADRIRKYVNEPGLTDAVAETLNRYLFFTTDITQHVEDTSIFLICVQTPSNSDGSSDLTYYFDAITNLVRLVASRSSDQHMVIVNKSTVPIGTVRTVQQIIMESGAKNISVVSNPEFLAQGRALEDARRPDRIIVGADTQIDFHVLRRVNSPFLNHVRIRYIETTPETAEAIKYMSNSLILTYISFWSGVGARIAEKYPNVRMDDLRVGVTSDSRVSSWGSYASNGAGGSCLDKDIRSLIFQLSQVGASTDLLQSVYNINEYQKEYLIERAIQEAGFVFSEKTVALLGLAYKKRTNDMRNSSSLRIVDLLLQHGVKSIQSYDPVAQEQAKEIWFNPNTNYIFDRISYANSAKEAIVGSDAVIVSTDWEEFRGLSSTIEQSVKPPYLIIDGRRMIGDYDTLVAKGYDYLPVGGGLERCASLETKKSP